MIWDLETETKLREFWAAGISTAEIGRRLHTSKNAIVGKAHRLDLTARPSPIKRNPNAPKPVRIQQFRLPLLASTVTEAPKPAPRPVIEAPRKVFYLAPRPTAAGGCQFPIGEPGTREFRFCEAPVLVPTKANPYVRGPWSYCAGCRDVAYTPRRAEVVAA